MDVFLQKAISQIRQWIVDNKMEYTECLDTEHASIFQFFVPSVVVNGSPCSNVELQFDMYDGGNPTFTLLAQSLTFSLPISYRGEGRSFLLELVNKMNWGGDGKWELRGGDILYTRDVGLYKDKYYETALSEYLCNVLPIELEGVHELCLCDDYSNYENVVFRSSDPITQIRLDDRYNPPFYASSKFYANGEDQEGGLTEEEAQRLRRVMEGIE